MDKEKESESFKKQKLIETKTQQIKEILESEDITYGIAKAIIQRVEAELLKSGDISEYVEIQKCVSNYVYQPSLI